PRAQRHAAGKGQARPRAAAAEETRTAVASPAEAPLAGIARGTGWRGAAPLRANQAIVDLRPSSKSTFGDQPSRALASEISGLRRRGSSMGSGCVASLDGDPVIAMTRRASSTTLTSTGLPRLTGPRT